MNTEQITQKLNIIDLAIRVPNPTAVSSRRVDGDEKVFKAVNAAFCNTRTFAPFQAMRRRMERLCLSKGTRLCGGFAVPDEALPGVLEGIKTAQAVFEQDRAKLVAAWPEPVEQWVAQHPSEEVEIRSIAPSAGVINAGLSFDVRLYKVASQTEALNHYGVKDGLAGQVSGLAMQIASEVAAEARDFWRSRQEAGRAEQTARVGLNRWLGKIKSLLFIDPRLSRAVKLLEDGINALPTSGMIEGGDFITLSGLVSIMSDPNTILNEPVINIGQKENEPVAQPPASVTPVRKRVVGW
ncbi:DUF3150 domain-containing protein [Ferrovum sp.]|uniref:DUF3150 domain-containing protein n=1 Tax=Ferrovum sp. TaxID=2609467 RepID=UPI002635C254|nr:DUF3150 domain-containing protein [Ferrovum sp.]